MISLDGASLLAQVIPVLVLIVAVERRGLGYVKAARTLPGFFWWVARLVWTGLAVIGAVFAELWCITAVCSGVAPVGVNAAIVTVGGFLVGCAAAFATVSLALSIFDPLGGKE